MQRIFLHEFYAIPFKKIFSRLPGDEILATPTINNMERRRIIHIPRIICNKRIINVNQICWKL